MRLCYDIETNGLEPDTIHCMVIYNLDNNQTYKFSDVDPAHMGILDGIRMLQKADLLVGHNIISFDNYWIKQLYNIDLSNIKIHDTLIMSQVLRYKRQHRHGLGAWGQFLKNRKIEFDQWHSYTKEMMKYCVQDVHLNVDVYHYLVKEFKAIAQKNKLIVKGLQVEHAAAIFNTRTRERGWNFDLDKAQANLKYMRSKMSKIEKIMEPKLGMRKIYIDKLPKTPKYTKKGWYTATSARLLSEYLHKTVKPEDAVSTCPPIQPGQEFQRSRQEQITMGSMDLVKEWLKSIGWKPDEWVIKKIGFEWIKQSPKLTTTSLVKLGAIGRLIDRYYTLRSRSSVIEGWIDQLKDGRLHGNMWTIGTPTYRCRHEVIVNLPAVSARYGKKLRELFKADENTVLVGADSSGNQLRGLCHYVGNDDFTNEVIYGDQHQRNADALNCSRPVAKSYLYAYLFGAGDGKLGQVLTGKSNAHLGKESRDKFASSIKGLQELRDKLSNVWKNTHYTQGEGWFPAVDGRPVFCPAEHQTLNYLLQSMEGISCKAALDYAMKKIKEENLRAEPRLFYHDEQAWVSHPDDARRVGEILQESFKEAPKEFGINCMDGGDYIIGTSYADVH